MTKARDDRPKRIIVIHPSDEMYGADKVLLEALRTAPTDAKLEVWLPTDVDYPRRELSAALTERGIAFRHLPLAILRRAYLRPKQLPRLFVRFLSSARLLIKMRPDLVYVNTAAAAPYLPIARVVGARGVLHLHEYLSGGTKIVAPFLHFAHSIVAVSRAIVQPLPARVKRRVKVVRNGFDIARPSDLPSFDGGIRCVVASRWNAWKGHAVLLQAWDSTTRSDLHLEVLGAAPGSGEATDVPAIVGGMEHAARIRISGQTDDTRSALDRAHVVLVPSVQPDPLPTIAIEALAAGRCLIGSDLGGMPEISGDAGILVAAGDVKAWREALEKLTEEVVRKYAARARGRFDSEFTRARFDDEIQGALWTW